MSYPSYEFAYEWEGEYEFNENELANRLLTLQTEEELDQFLGGLVSTAWRGAKALYNSPLGQAVKRHAVSGLKSIGRKALPSLGRAVGGYVGGQLGRSVAGHFLGQEYEAAPAEERDYETARRLVLTARQAARDIGRYLESRGSATRRAIRGFILKAARRYFPGLPPARVRPLTTTTSRTVYTGTYPTAPRPGIPSAKTQGTWYRQGRRIVVNLV